MQLGEERMIDQKRSAHMSTREPERRAAESLPRHAARRHRGACRALLLRARLAALMLASAGGAALASLLAFGALHSSAGGGSGPGDVGRQAIPVTLKSAGGAVISLPRQGRPGVLLFAASACASCIRAASALNVVEARLGGHLDALMVDLDARDGAAALSAWQSAVGRPDYPLAIDTTGRLAAAYAVEGLGTTIVYNARGRIVARAANPGVGEIEHDLRKAGVRI